MEATFVVIGGGICGVSCAESIAFLAPEEKVVLITASSIIKAVTNVMSIGKTLTQFDVEERSSDTLSNLYPSITIINDVVKKVDTSKKTITTEKEQVIIYKKLCICTGARPKLIQDNNSRVIGLRDTESAENLTIKLKNAKKVVIVGNGGIATELVHEIKGVDVVWVIKDRHISATFIDPGAAEFFQERLLNKDLDYQEKTANRPKWTVKTEKSTQNGFGPSLGPHWHNQINLIKENVLKRVEVEYECEVLQIINRTDSTDDWPIYVELTNGKKVGADFIISATGVIPNSNILGLEHLKKGKDSGYSVDWKLETMEKDIFAAGDVCSAEWDIAKHWFQMRLWTQAHQMGRYAAKSMVSTLKEEDFYQDFCFELFTHVTKFFGYKVVLIGLYNGQKLGNSYDILLRVTQRHEYVKLILVDGKMQGAVLIGETDLEEMCENLILNQLDLSPYGEDLLNPDIDIEDYFD
ncbi:pyridine nucleotide-disulfide oxidoreductase domain-containing protein 1 [Copidosoma floridanum]|uniref:pyridine nucleotide-disulfide oxidoreductase domain-containing protein 1 n=1 Tax=Copidosoma floridanum TaxID=29053 RepID=UPI0006C9DABE|nr:pyridine nucleotide-disulfide oxidoreductase domain-containing protein 1 [Copidosoma floridanum]